jgi:hypothetical protein
VLSAVRAFYLDIAEWADDDPARWGPWAVRCPVSASDVSHKKDRSRRKRTRERLPVLPALIARVDAERTRTAALLAAAEDTRPGEPFTSANGQTLRRAVMSTPATGRIWAEHVDGGPRQDLTFEEHRGFWTRAMEDSQLPPGCPDPDGRLGRRLPTHATGFRLAPVPVIPGAG